jgi:hypothetical protein
MVTTAQTLPPTDPSEFESLAAAWQRFADEHAYLGLGDSRFAANRFMRRHYDQLAQRGAARRTASGRYIVHKQRFPIAAFELLTVEGVAGVGNHRKS